MTISPGPVSARCDKGALSAVLDDGRVIGEDIATGSTPTGLGDMTRSSSAA